VYTVGEIYAAGELKSDSLALPEGDDDNDDNELKNSDLALPEGDEDEDDEV